MPAPLEPDAAPSRWRRVHARLHRNRAMSLTTKIVVTLVGLAVLCAGIVMMVTPGPGLVGIAAGLAILATEWEWAERWLTKAREKLADAAEKAAGTDPVVRRRRLIWTTVISMTTAVAVVGYLVWRDWPAWSISLWDRAQRIIGFLPDLPGM